MINTKSKVSQTELQAAIADLADLEDVEMREAMLVLIKQGRIVDSGKRRDGHIMWLAAQHATRH
jgi:hypothetical protein